MGVHGAARIMRVCRLRPLNATPLLDAFLMPA
jgi:hypothetical protein